MPKSSHIAATLLSAWLCLGPSPAVRAQSGSDPRSRSHELCLQAEQALSARDLGQAERLLEQALRVSALPEISLYLGRIAEQQGRAVAAADHFRRYLAAMGESLDEASRSRILAGQQALREPVAELDILGPSGSLLYVDDHLVGVLPLSGPMMLSATSHRFRIVVKQSRFESDPLDLTPSMRAELHLTPGTSGTAVAILSLSSEWLVVIEPTEMEPAQRALVEQTVATLAKRERASLLAPQRLSRALKNRPASCLHEPSCQESVARELGTRAVVRIRLDQTAGKLRAEWFDIDGGGVAATRERSCGACRETQLQQAASVLGGELLREAQNHPRGVLEVSSSPTGAQVEIDGQARGVTPYQRALLIGKHAVRLTHDGYRDFQQSVEIIAGKNQSLDATLEPEQSTVVTSGSGPNGPPAKRPLWRFLVGGGLIGTGVLLSGLGLSAWSRNGSCADTSAPPPDAPCNYLYSTGAVGAGLFTVGLGLTIGGALLIAWPAKATADRTASRSLR